MTKQERSDYCFNYLKSEGYTPEIDDDGDIKLKIEGGRYFVVINEDDGVYYQIIYPNFYQAQNDSDRAKLFESCNAVSIGTKVVKILTMKDKVWASLELFLPTPEAFTAVFKRSISALQYAVKKFNEIQTGAAKTELE